MNQNYNKSSFERFGDDLCQRILSFVGHWEGCKLKMVSKQWLRLYKRSMFNFNPPKANQFNLSYMTTERINTDIVQNGTQYKSLSLHGLHQSYNALNEIMFDKCVNLNEIYIYFDEWIDKRLVLGPKTPKILKRLNSIHLTFNIRDNETKGANKFSPFESFARNCGHNIKSIGFTFHTLITDNMLNRLSIGLSQMKALSAMKINFQINNDDDDHNDHGGDGITVLLKLMTQIGANCPQLKSLSLYFLWPASEVLAIINDNFKQLKHLKVNALFGETSVITSGSLKSLKRLTHLRLDLFFKEVQEKHVNQSFFIDIQNNLPQLLVLRLNDVMITDGVLNALSRLTPIRYVRLNGINKCTQMAVNNLYTNCPKVNLQLTPVTQSRANIGAATHAVPHMMFFRRLKRLKTSKSTSH